MNWDEYNRNLLDKCKDLGIPFSACFELTPFCNFKCNMCYVRLEPEQACEQGKLLSTQQWINIAKEARALGTTTLEITGGEATTRRDFSVLYESFARMGFVINLRTNGYAITGDILDLLIRYKPARIGITLYGASNETYQRVCGVSDGFSVVTRNIIALRDAGLRVHLTMTMTKENQNDVDALNEWAAKNNLHISAYGGLFNPIRGVNRSIDHLKIRYSDEECEISDDMQFKPHEIENRSQYMNPFWMCRGFGAMFCICWDGRMTLCNGMTYVWENPLMNSVETAYHSLYKKLRKLSRPEKCGTCQYIDYCISCPTQIISETGSINQTCEEICRRARRRYKRELLISRTDNTYNADVSDLICEEGEDEK